MLYARWTCPRIYPHVKPWQGRPCPKHARLGLWSRPHTPALAGPRPRTCVHVNATLPPASGHLHACPSASGRPRLGRRDRPRPAALTNVL
eukprot:366555-Chlamydomonas_euryale.AAC.28